MAFAKFFALFFLRGLRISASSLGGRGFRIPTRALGSEAAQVGASLAGGAGWIILRIRGGLKTSTGGAKCQGARGAEPGYHGHLREQGGRRRSHPPPIRIAACGDEPGQYFAL